MTDPTPAIDPTQAAEQRLREHAADDLIYVWIRTDDVRLILRELDSLRALRERQAARIRMLEMDLDEWQEQEMDRLEREARSNRA